MPKNLELKAILHQKDKAIAVAKSLGARFAGEFMQEDTYFDVPKGRLKLRQMDDETAELIYYEREEESGQRVSRFETIRIENPSKFKSFLAGAIGNRAVVRKNRLVFMYGCTRIHLDEVENLGSFIELEVPIGESHQTARKTLDLLVKEFQIGPEDYLRCSYVDMFLVSDSSGVLHSPLKEKD